MKNTGVMGVLLACVLLVGIVSAVEVTWVSSSGCWTATDGTYNYTKWNATGTTSWVVPTGVVNVSYLVVGGGGSGQGTRGVDGSSGGGGHAGVLLMGSGFSVTSGDTVPVVVGIGGIGVPASAADGKFSLFSTLNATGGNGSTDYWTSTPRSGGNGAGGGPTLTHNGGVGLSSNITGSTLWYAGGGGGADSDTLAPGGSGVGGNGARYNNGGPTSGVNGTGSGGGGHSAYMYSYAGGSGGTGAVIIKYLTAPSVSANFTATPLQGDNPLVVQFTDTSSGSPTSWLWDFGDGGTSTLKNPAYVYNSHGLYDVSLYANTTLTNDTETKVGYILVSDRPIASFTSNTTGGPIPTTVQFNDTSALTPTSWSWSYRNQTPGNNTKIVFSTAQNPVATFGVGVWDIRLNATNAGGSSETTQAYNITVPGLIPVTTYFTPGTYTWTAPNYATLLDVYVIGGGGSGRGGGHDSDGHINAGLGGSSGEGKTATGFVPTPGASYTIVVGAGGARGAVEGGYNSGTGSSAFGYSSAGGAGDGMAPWAGGGGGGATGYYAPGGNSEDGEWPACASGASAGGDGYGAGGGGGWSLWTSGAHCTGYGGAGSDGLVYFVSVIAPGVNIADFNATDTEVPVGTVVHFIDESTIVSPDTPVYFWTFGDGTNATSIPGDMNHVYANIGTYDVSLKVTSSYSNNTKVRYGFISVVYDSTGASIIQVEPRLVTFSAQTFWGEPIPDAEIVVTPLSTSTGTWTWLLGLFGAQTTNTTFDPSATVMRQYTDSNGDTEFYVLPTGKYHVDVTGPPTSPLYTFTTGDIVPSGSEYTFRADLITTDLYTHGYNELEQVFFTANGTEISPTHAHIDTTYTDLLGQTTSVFVDVGQNVNVGNSSTWVSVTNFTSGAGNFSHQFGMTNHRDQSYVVRMTSQGITFGNITRVFGVTFPPGPISLGIPESLLVYLGMFLMIFITLAFVRTLPGPAVIISMFFGWIFWFMGWWKDLADPIVTVSALTFFSVMAIIFNIMIRSKKVYDGGG